MSTTTITTCHENLYSIPIKDAACAMPIGGNNPAINELLLLRRLRRLLQTRARAIWPNISSKRPSREMCGVTPTLNATATRSVLSTEAGTVVATVSETASGSRSSVGASSTSTSGGVVAGLVI
ncbi:hypothetical protein ETB97_006036 [Aspergillus alliaceus]|uniref:Uncharacterized protein n=1 Tax=Petromyces alliaceus TaxID=209559 RepID=A0A8H6E3M0_PETAA|nr:hypothetical protein ETB97_006036 [Aspergillus burnettii]